jgi:hypothetical protein
VKHTRSKTKRGLVSQRIVYRDRLRPHQRPQELTIDVRHGEVLDADHAAAIVAVRTGTSLRTVSIVAIAGVKQ